MDKIQVEYSLVLTELKKQGEEIKATLKGVESEGKKSAQNIEGGFKNLGGQLNKLGSSTLSSIKSQFTDLAKAAAGAFAVQQIMSFTAEAVKLAATAEGVERAFGKLNKPGLLEELRKATKGTVSDLELMKSAVKANNFQLPLEQLGTLFKFAQQRAQETGESVDYLTESIVLGISRKSIPILDNLGISSTQIQEEFKKTGDFAQAVGNIVQQSLQKQGDAIETTADKMARASAQWENFKKGFGEFAITAWTGLMDGLDAFDLKLRNLFGMEIPGAAKKQADLNAKVQTGIEGLNAYMFGQKEQAKTTEKQTQNLEGLNQQLQSLKDILNKAEIGSTAFKDAQKEIIKVEEEIARATGQETEAMKKNREEKEKALKLQNELKEALQEITSQNLNDNRDLLGKTPEDYEKEAKEREKQLADEKEREEEFQAFNLALQIKAAKESKEARLKEEEQYAQRRAEINAAIEQTGRQALDGILSLARANRQRDMEELTSKQQQEQQLLQEQLDNKLISEDVYSQKKKELDAKQADELRKQKTKQFEAERNEALFKIAIETAVAVAKAIAASPVTFGLPFSAFALAQGALQAGFVMAQPIPKFAKGVIDLKGKGTTTSDSIPAFLSRGESVMTAIETEKHKRALQAMRDGTFDNHYVDYEKFNRIAERAEMNIAKSKAEKQVNDLAKALAITLNGSNNSEDLYYINKQLRANKEVRLAPETIEQLGNKLGNTKGKVY